MFIACDRKYFEIGDVVIQNNFAGATAKVIAMRQDDVNGEYRYTLEVDVSNHPDGFDENGERVSTMTTQVWAKQLAALNP